MPEYDTLIYEKPEADIVRIWLNRDPKNAQNRATYLTTLFSRS